MLFIYTAHYPLSFISLLSNINKIFFKNKNAVFKNKVTRQNLCPYWSYKGMKTVNNFPGLGLNDDYGKFYNFHAIKIVFVAFFTGAF